MKTLGISSLFAPWRKMMISSDVFVFYVKSWDFLKKQNLRRNPRISEKSEKLMIRSMRKPLISLVKTKHSVPWEPMVSEKERNSPNFMEISYFHYISLKLPKFSEIS